MAEMFSLGLLADGLLIVGASTAGFYCWALGRRLKALKSLDSGLGAAVSSMSGQVDDIRTALDEAKAQSRVSAEKLIELTEEARVAAERLEGLNSGPVGDDDELTDMSEGAHVAEKLEELIRQGTALSEQLAQGAEEGAVSPELEGVIARLDMIEEAQDSEPAAPVDSGSEEIEGLLSRSDETAARLKSLIEEADSATELLNSALQNAANAAPSGQSMEDASDVMARLVGLTKVAETAAAGLEDAIAQSVEDDSRSDLVAEEIDPDDDLLDGEELGDEDEIDLQAAEKRAAG